MVILDGADRGMGGGDLRKEVDLVVDIVDWWWVEGDGEGGE